METNRRRSRNEFEYELLDTGATVRGKHPLLFTGNSTNHAKLHLDYPDEGPYLSDRLTRIFLRDERGRRAVYRGTQKFQTDPHGSDYVLFYEYFHGDNGAGREPRKALEGGKAAVVTRGKAEAEAKR